MKWCGKSSYGFLVKNGVRQGAVSSGILFAIYIDDILSMLHKSGLGCHSHGVFYGFMQMTYYYYQPVEPAYKKWCKFVSMQ